jgi:5,10-methylenetetrahydrofolate reductase
VDHVADYKPPKDEEEEARKRKLDAGEEVCRTQLILMNERISNS